MYEIDIYSIGFFWYKFGTTIKNNSHQRMIKKLTNDVKIKLWNNIQIETNTAIPNKIIDQGWHQKGFKSQNFFS